MSSLFCAKPLSPLWALVSLSRKPAPGPCETLSALVTLPLLLGSKSFSPLCTPHPRGGGCFQHLLLAGLPRYSLSVSGPFNTCGINPPCVKYIKRSLILTQAPLWHRKPPSGPARPYLQLLELAVDSGQVPARVHVLQLAFHVKELLVQLSEALHQLVGLAGFKELPRLGLGGALQLGPALPDLTQLLPHRGRQLWLLLHQLLALLPQRV